MKSLWMAVAWAAALAMAVGAAACGGGSKPPMTPDNDQPLPAEDAGAAAPASSAAH